MKNNSTVFCGLASIHFNDSESNDSESNDPGNEVDPMIAFQSPEYIYCRKTTSIKIISVLEK